MPNETEKLCPHCGKKLRSDNTRGACSDCLKAPENRPSQGRASKPARSDVMKRFRVVASALGKDPNSILEEAAKTWLDSIVEAIK